MGTGRLLSSKNCSSQGSTLVVGYLTLENLCKIHPKDLHLQGTYEGNPMEIKYSGGPFTTEGTGHIGMLLVTGNPTVLHLI